MRYMMLRQNPPKRRKSARKARRAKGTSAAVRAKIARAVRAAHKRGVYGKKRSKVVRRSTKRSVVVRKSSRSPARRSTRRRVRRSVSVSVSRPRRSSRRRSGGGGMIGGGKFLGVGKLLSASSLQLAAGTVAGSFAVTFASAFIGKYLPANIGSNVFARSGIKLVAGALGAKLVSRYNRNVAEGIAIGAVVSVLNDLMMKFLPGVAPAATANSTGEYLGRSVGAYLNPGRPIQSLTSPANAPANAFIGSVYDSPSAFRSDPWARR